MSKWELTKVLSQYLDRHLVALFFEFHAENGVYDETDLGKAKLDLLEHTSMVDFWVDEYKKLYPDKEVPQKMHDKRNAVVAEFKKLQNETKPIFTIFEDPQVTVQVRF